MSFFTNYSSSSASAYTADHPFSYRRDQQQHYDRQGTSTISRVGTHIWETFANQTNRRSTDRDALHDMALTAQPPILKRKHTPHNNVSSAEAVLALTEEVLVGLALCAAAAFVTRYAVRGLWAALPRSLGRNDNNTTTTTTGVSSSSKNDSNNDNGNNDEDTVSTAETSSH